MALSPCSHTWLPTHLDLIPCSPVTLQDVHLGKACEAFHFRFLVFSFYTTRPISHPSISTHLRLQTRRDRSVNIGLLSFYLHLRPACRGLRSTSTCRPDPFANRRFDLTDRIWAVGYPILSKIDPSRPSEHIDIYLNTRLAFARSVSSIVLQSCFVPNSVLALALKFSQINPPSKTGAQH